jgi:hypothetical protein
LFVKGKNKAKKIYKRDRWEDFKEEFCSPKDWVKG